MAKLLLFTFLLGVLSCSNALRSVNFDRVRRESLASTLITNARIEPAEFSSVRAQRDGALRAVAVDTGSAVRAGQLIAEIDAPEVAAAIREAESRIAQARADLRQFEEGGTPAALAEIQNGIAKVRQELKTARAQLAAAERLAEKKAETRQNVEEARAQVERLDLELRALENKRAALVPPGGKEAVLARQRQAQADLELARTRGALARVTSPINGTVYNLAVRMGAFVRTGDLIAEIGDISRLRAVVFVDEPELGRVAKGMRVRLTWDAKPDREWQGHVEKLPARIVALGTRQVGEVICSIANPDGTLVPGANVNAEIRSRVVENALTVPKESIRREGNSTGVFVLNGERVEWRPVKTGIAGTARIEIMEGLREGEAVALATSEPLAAGEQVLPRLP